MNEQNPYPYNKLPGVPPSVPPLIPGGTSPFPPGEPPLGADEIERSPITGVVGVIESILRQPRRVMFQLKQMHPGPLIVSLLAIAIVCSVIYGLVVGSFTGGDQWWAAPAKIATGLLISALITLPSLYIFSCLGGSQARLVEVLGLVGGLLALMTILLIGFAPVAWVFSQSTSSPMVMGTLHLLFWGVATIFGVPFLSDGFKHMQARSSGSLKTWVVIFVLVCLQMTTALRPILGKSEHLLPPSNEKKFFVGHWMDCFDEEAKANGTRAEGRR